MPLPVLPSPIDAELGNLACRYYAAADNTTRLALATEFATQMIWATGFFE